MNRKNKLMLAAAIFAVLILIGSGVARCTMQRTASNEQVSSSQAQSEQSSASVESQTQSTENTVLSMDSLIGTNWVSETDATQSLAIVKGAFVETKDGTSSVTYWSVDSEKTDKQGLSANLLVSKSATEAANPVILQLDLVSSPQKLKCDALVTTYVKTTTSTEPIQLSGVTDDLAKSLNVSIEDIESAVQSRAAALSPSAKRAIWDGEVWIDFTNKTATTSFTLDDKAATMISVTRDADGKVEAL